MSTRSQSLTENPTAATLPVRPTPRGRRGAAAAVALAALCLVLLRPAPAAGQNVTVKMATLVPEGSSWHQILKEMAEQWKTASGGRVTVRLYAGGVAGDDPDVVRKMRLGTLNSGVLTAIGLAEIDKSVYALGVPLMYESYDEVYHVLDKLRPRLERAIEAKGFKVLTWADAGWVHIFAQKPVRTPDDLRALKLFAWAGDNEAIELYKAAGFNPVPLPSTELSTALQTGLVNAVVTAPQVAVISQYYNHAKNMTDLRWGLLLGAMVVDAKVWEKVPADVRPQLAAAAERAGKRLRDEVRASASRDIEAMKKRGLVVVPVDPKAAAQWRSTIEALYPKVRGPIVPADAFDEAKRLRDEYRAKGGAPKPPAAAKPPNT